MELSKLEHSFKVAMDELSAINGRVFVLCNLIIQSRERIVDDSRVGHELMAAGLTFRDITLPKDVDNLFSSPNHYELSRWNLQEEVEMILSRECLLHIAQCYEILETYLYNIVAEFIRQKSTMQIFTDNKKNASTFNSIRKALKGLSERTNNRHLVNILRANSPVYSKSEGSNIYDLDFRQWYEMLGEVRHCVTHSRMVVSADFTADRIRCFSDFLSIRDYAGVKVLLIDYHGYSELFNKIVDYIGFIYKAVAEECYGHKVTFHTLEKILSGRYSRVVN